ncbi:MAG: carbon-monoxide dehydrogenase small subunit [Gammaproteobacteria bacterium]|jgi:carbon-monoxide dehydrogenase small subunit
MYAVQVDAALVCTLEDLADGVGLHPLRRAFSEHGALQCGFCTPALLMTADLLLRRKPAATALEIRVALDGNLYPLHRRSAHCPGGLSMNGKL